MDKGTSSALSVAIALGACAYPAPPLTVRTAYVAEEHEPYLRAGSSIIRGQGFLRQRGGGTVTCAGSDVFLMPATPYFRELTDIVRTGRQVPAGVSVRQIPSVRIGQCDAQGNFSFQKLPAANWIVSTHVVWSVGGSRQGGTLAREVTSNERDSVTVLLSDRDFTGR